LFKYKNYSSLSDVNHHERDTVTGAGKSTKTKELVGNGIIHSTDDLIEATGDYAGHFAKMIESNDWSAHTRMHTNNFKNAKKSMEDGISPVIVDNTNIKANEPKKYVEAALKMGFSENNIKFVDVADGGCTAEVLAERNTHGVPLETIEKMMVSHKGVGPLTVKKVMESKDMYKAKKIAMVVLDDKSRTKLLDGIKGLIKDIDSSGWDVIAHHMTVNFGKGLPENLKDDLGNTVQLKVTKIGISDMAIAVGVEGYHSDNAKPHITIAVNKAKGGKPVMSNDIQIWERWEGGPNLSGKVTEQKLG